MNQTTLEALLIDRAFGELSDEASELLDAWIVEHPECLASAGEMELLIGGLQSAIDRKTIAVGTRASECLGRGRALRRTRGRIMAWAACFAVGLLLGVVWYWKPLAKRTIADGKDASFPELLDAAGEIGASGSGVESIKGDFWSVANWSDRVERPARWTWDWLEPVGHETKETSKTAREQ